jgi:hypothetical protein
LRQFLGAGFDVVESTVGAWLFGRPATSAVEAIFTATWVLASVTGSAQPAADDAAIGFVTTRLGLPPTVAQAFRAALRRPQ